MQVAGEKTIIFERWETRYVERSTGFGFNFEEFVSKAADGCEETIGHYRVVAYVRVSFHMQRFITPVWAGIWRL